MLYLHCYRFCSMYLKKYCEELVSIIKCAIYNCNDEDYLNICSFPLESKKVSLFWQINNKETVEEKMQK